MVDKRLVSSSIRPSWAWTFSLTSIFFFSISSSFALKVDRADLDISSSSLVMVPLKLKLPEIWPDCIRDCWFSSVFWVCIIALLFLSTENPSSFLISSLYCLSCFLFLFLLSFSQLSLLLLLLEMMMRGGGRVKGFLFLSCLQVLMNKAVRWGLKCLKLSLQLSFCLWWPTIPIILITFNFFSSYIHTYSQYISAYTHLYTHFVCLTNYFNKQNWCQLESSNY